LRARGPRVADNLPGLLQQPGKLLRLTGELLTVFGEADGQPKLPADLVLGLNEISGHNL
jgi:hypothetical protein